MDFKRILIKLLGLQDINIEDFKVFNKKLRVEIKASQISEKCKCKDCNNKLYGIHQWERKDIKLPPLGIFSEVVLKLKYLRAACDSCQKIKTANTPFQTPRFKSMSCGFVEIAGRLMEETTCEASARLLRVKNERIMWNIGQYRMQYMLQYMKLPEELDVTLLSADEIHFRTKKPKQRKNMFEPRGTPEFVTNLVCYTNSKVLFNSMGRDSESLKNCLSMLSDGQRMAVEFFAVDMHDPFIKIIKEMCPNAKICVDRFHLVQKVNDCFDELRKSERKRAEKENDSFEFDMLSPSRRFVMMERSKNVSKSEQKMLDKLRDVNKNIHNGMLIMEYFHTVLDKKDIKGFRKSLANWYLLIRESKLKPFLKLAATIRKYRQNIEAYISSHLTTAVSEGLNNKIKVLKRMGYGYANEVSFRLKILQRCGFLNSNHINTDNLLWHADSPR